MAEFTVLFDPPLPEAAPVAVPTDLDWPMVYRLSRGLNRRFLEYVISGQRWGYDREDLFNVLDDLLGALGELDSSSSQSFMMSGYSVVGVTRHDDLITFYDLGDPKGWSAQIGLADVREALTTAACRVWGVISDPTRGAEHEQ